MDRYVTITGCKHYFDLSPFAIKTRLLCEKEPDNVYDSEAICVLFPVLGKVGYIANSVQTKANGTMSAARIYESVGNRFIVQVAFTVGSSVIAKIICDDAKDSCPNFVFDCLLQTDADNGEDEHAQ